MTGADAHRIKVRIQHEDFDAAAEVAALTKGRLDVGAVVTFTGLCRDEGAKLTALELEHYPGMTEKSLLHIAEQAAQRWSLQAARIVHRVGKMYPGDQIVMVLTASAHRGDAYEANQFMMDYLKTEAPFWKKEWTPEGPRWIEARDSDDHAASKWKQ